MVLIAIRLMRRVIDRALEHFGSVRVINSIGNHDTLSSRVLSIALAEGLNAPSAEDMFGAMFAEMPSHLVEQLEEATPGR